MEHIPSTKEYPVDSIGAGMWRARALRAERQLEALQLVALYAQDIVNGWSSMTIRTISQMTAKVASLKQALDLLK